MWPLRCISLKLVLKLTVVVVSLWSITLLSLHKTGWGHTYIFSYGWLDYSDDDGDPEAVCNCSAILQGDTDEIEKAKMLSISRNFRRSVQIPDEYYINATQDCRCVAGFGDFITLSKYIFNTDSVHINIYSMYIYCI